MGRRQNNPSIGWVHPKSTHGHPLAQGNKILRICMTIFWNQNSF